VFSTANYEKFFTGLSQIAQLDNSRLVLHAASGIAIALFLIIPPAFKWEIKQRIAIAGAVAFGLCSGVVSFVVDGIYPIAPAGQFALQGSTTVMMALVAAALMFYRDPERTAPEGTDTIMSPADGMILYVKRIKNGKVPLSTKKRHTFRIDELAGTGALDHGVYLVGIGMNILNVHVNRAPVQGKVKLIRPMPGAFISLKIKDAILQNERRTTVIDNGDYVIGVIQIASRLVRRIESYVHEGQSVYKGERIGMILFGSQVDLVIPLFDNLDIAVKPGDSVKAGESVIANLNIEYANNKSNNANKNNKIQTI
jgi:phosphatidylserine decarboxylase